MNLREISKGILVRLVPERLYQNIRRLHYLYTLKKYSRNNVIEGVEPEFGTIKYLIKPGDSVVDVGANYGLITLFLSRLVGECGSVYSVEPIPLTFEILLNNVKKLGLSNVRLFNYGISENSVSAIMEVPKFNFGAENFYQAKIISNVKQESSLKHFKVNLKSLDSLLNDRLDNIKFIKIDVEGHELQAVNGARQLIKHSKPALYIEVSGDPDDVQSSAAKLFNLLNNEGYLPYCYCGDRLKRRTRGNQSVNYFFLTDEQFNKLQV